MTQIEVPIRTKKQHKKTYGQRTSEPQNLRKTRGASALPLQTRPANFDGKPKRQRFVLINDLPLLPVLELANTKPFF